MTRAARTDQVRLVRGAVFMNEEIAGAAGETVTYTPAYNADRRSAGTEALFLLQEERAGVQVRSH